MYHSRPLFLYFVLLTVKKCSISKFANDCIRNQRTSDVGSDWSVNRATTTAHCLFSVFSNKQYNKCMWKMSSSSIIQHRDSNPQPLKHELSTITTSFRPKTEKYLFTIFLLVTQQLIEICKKHNGSKTIK